MKHFPVLNEISAVSFESGIQAITKEIEHDSSVLKIEGLPGSSRTFFLAHLTQSINRPIIVLTPDQNSGEKLVSDLKYFYQLRFF